jgi:tetratricopeptide (TPR) repeat protein
MDRLASIYVRTERVEDGINLYQKLIKRNPNDKIFHYNLACVYSRSKDSIKGFEYLEKALKIGMYDYADWLQKDPDLSFLKSQTEIWNALMQKYFPDKFK